MTLTNARSSLRRTVWVLAFAAPMGSMVALHAAQYPTSPPPGAQPTPAQPAAPNDPNGPPRLPPFAGTVVSFDRRGERVVACVDRSTVPLRGNQSAPSPPPSAQAGPKLPPAYRIWLIEREVMQELMTTGGLCAPSWSPDGKSFVAAGARGVFVFSEPQYEARVLALGTMPPPAASGAAAPTSGPPPASATAPGTAATPPPATVPTTTGTADTSTFTQLAWSPSGRRVAFVALVKGVTSVRVVDTTDGAVVWSKDQAAKLIQWGPDDRTIVVDGTRSALP